MAEQPCFDPAVRRFFTGLAKHNDREWFAAHRADHDRLVREPLEALAAGPAARYGDAHVFRPNRDVRFSADKRPYKLNGSVAAGGVGSVYLEVDADGISAGGGLYEPQRDQRRRAREAIDEDSAAAEALEAAVGTLERQGFEIAGPSLATVPRGYPRDHPRIELLRLQHYAAVRRLPLDAPESAVRAAWSAVEPLIAWVERYVGPTTESWR